MRVQRERKLQRECIRWFSLQYPKLSPLLYATPNGGKRNSREAYWLKREGVKAGIPDLFLALPKNGYCGLYIELKQGNNKPTEIQEYYAVALSSQGYKVAVVYNIDEFISAINTYLND